MSLGSMVQVTLQSLSKAPSDFQQSTWIVEHNKCLDDVCKGCVTKSLSFFKENQNSFTAKRGNMTIKGKPDLIVLGSDKKYTVYDIKTGQPKASDVIQVMLYMTFLPYSTSGIYKGKAINGNVVYKNGEKTNIPSHSVDDNFRAQELISTQQMNQRGPRVIQSANSVTLQKRIAKNGLKVK